MTTGAYAGPDSAENVKIPHAVLDMVIARRCATTGAGLSRQCRKLDSPQLVPLLDKVVDVPVLATSWRSRGSAAAVPRLVCHHGYDELMRLLFRAVYTGTRPGLTPAIGAGKGWRGRRELAPRCSATQLAARRNELGQTRRFHQSSEPPPPRAAHDMTRHHTTKKTQRHTRTRTCICTCMCTCIRIRIRICMCMCMCMYMCMCMCTCRCSYFQKKTQSGTRTFHDVYLSKPFDLPQWLKVPFLPTKCGRISHSRKN